MSSTTVHTQVRISKVDQAIGSIPELLRNGGSAARAILLRAALALKRRIHKAFVDKARGSTDDAGERWQPLSPVTIAYRRAKRTKTEKGRKSHPSQALSESQVKRWRAIFASVMSRSSARLGIPRNDLGPEAERNAAKTAWAILKREGATTLFAKYKDVNVEILRDTGLLLNSLNPEIKSSKHAVVRIEGNVVAVGTNRPGASAHHHGNPRQNLPQRRLWPAPAKWPSGWWRDIIEQVQQGIVDLAIQRVRGS